MSTKSSLSHHSRRTFLQLVSVSCLLPLNSNAAIPISDPDPLSTLTTLPSGLSYYDFVSPPITAKGVNDGSKVAVWYTLGSVGARNGWRIASNVDEKPLVFTVGKGEVVRGLDEGVLGMRVGGKRRVVIPAKLGWKTKDDRPVIMGFAEWQRFKNIYFNENRIYKPDLVMDVTLVKVDATT